MNDPELVDEARRWLRFATAVSQARGVYNSIAAEFERRTTAE